MNKADKNKREMKKFERGQFVKAKYAQRYAEKAHRQELRRKKGKHEK